MEYLVGGPDRLAAVRPLPPYDPLAIGFLGELSRVLLADPEARLEGDVVAFAYWCRSANLARLQQAFDARQARLGRGVVFHIAPSNVPVNFAFSFAFALLAGNASIVRVPTRAFPPTAIISRAVTRVLDDARYSSLAEMLVFVRYPQDDAISGAFSALCDARVIWGGDDTIAAIRRLPIPARCVEVTFADRYSCCVIDGQSVLRTDSGGLERLAGSFYNDAYLFDQNACSSPHLVMWLGEPAVVAEAQQALWGAVAAVAASRYVLQPVNAVDKYLLLCESAIDREDVIGFARHGNHVYRLALARLPERLETLRGRFGLFYEFTADLLEALALSVTSRFQTLTYYGVDPERLRDFVVARRLSGIDRIVPIGSALEMGAIWDGYDVVGSLSRIIDAR